MTQERSEPPETAAAGPRAAWTALADIFHGLADWQLRNIITTAMAPAIYLVCVGGVVAVNLYLTIEAFQRSLAYGLLWLLLFMPVISIAGVVAVRVLLESLLSLFRIVVHMEQLMEQIHTLRGQTESIADRVDDLPLPRIQFWRSRRSNTGGSKAD